MKIREEGKEEEGGEEGRERGEREREEGSRRRGEKSTSTFQPFSTCKFVPPLFPTLVTSW